MQTLRVLGFLAMMLLGGSAFAAQTATDAAGKEQPPIAGLEISRPTGGFLGLQLLNGNFVLSFYDADRQPKPIDVARAALRWPVKYQPNDERVVLNPGGDGVSLTSPKVIRPPHNFRLYIALFVEGNDDPVETHTVQFAPQQQ